MVSDDEGEDLGTEQGMDNMLWFGAMTYSLTNLLVIAYILIDWGINIDLYTVSYVLGSIFFIAIHGLVHIYLTKAIFERERSWVALVLTAVTFMTILWVFYGLGQPWRTFAIAGIGYTGLFLIGLSWLRQPEEERE